LSSEVRVRAELVAQVKVAAETPGLFQLVNHGVPGELMSEMLASVQQFHEVPSEAKRPNYTRDPGRRRERGGPAPVEQSAAAGG
jgi:isopenicillin N synthase-like dioxygenase